ncbi:MAG: adenylate/guanylate cyclase domain-containing protein [Chloroflexota bacterium]
MERPLRDLPTGTVTFLFSDIEGSTELADRLAPPTYRGLLEQHHRILREAFAAEGGVERGTQGDSFLVVFRDAPSALAAAVQAQRSLATETWPSDEDVRVRMGLHTGEGIPGGDDYVGNDINRAARIAAAAHGGQILMSETSMTLTRRTLPDGVELRDTGEHRLRGLTGPERIYQVTIAGHRSDFPPLRTGQVVAAHVPARMTSFVGRERDLAELLELLAENRLVTLLGPGGAGKTSLAIELARTAADDFPDGAWFVPLDAITDPDLVGSTIVVALGLRDVSGRTARERLLDNLADRRLLLLLDNFEQVLGAAGFIGELLASSTIKVIVTSRSPLQISAEQVYAVPPLPVPPVSGPSAPDELALIPSVALFVDRARRVQSTFALSSENVEPIADICRRLDGLPLGIELAAARVPLLGPSGIRDRLASRLPLPGSASVDVPARQRTLHDAIAWSHDLLDPSSQTLFARLAVFAGGCRAEELEAVCGPGGPPGQDALGSVADLVNQSLVMAVERRGVVRFEMLETIRESALERFAREADRAEIVRRHAIAYLALAEAGAPALRGRGQAPVIERFAAERDNLRAALRWAIDSGEAELGLRLATALTWFWAPRGELEEAWSAITAALAIPRAEAPTQVHMRGLESAGNLAYYSGRRDEASSYYLAQLDMARELDDPLGIADALFNVPFTVDPKDWAGVAHMIDEAARIYESLGEEVNLARTMWARAAASAAAGRRDEALALWREAYERSRQSNDAYYESLAASSLAATYLEAGDREAAMRWFIAALGLAREISDITGMTLALPIAALATIELVGPEPAAVMMGAYESQTRRFGIRPPPGLAIIAERGDPLARARAALEPATLEDALDRGRAMAPDETVAFVLGIFDRMGPPGGFGPR